MQELHVSNDLLSNRAALDEAWKRDGYWFFRDMLAREAVARLRAVYMEELAKLKVAGANSASRSALTSK